MNGVFLIDNGLGFVIVLAIILFFTKLFGLLFRKIGLPQVLGYIIAGIVVGPAIFGDLCGFTLIGVESDRYKALFRSVRMGLQHSPKSAYSCSCFRRGWKPTSKN